MQIVRQRWLWYIGHRRARVSISTISLVEKRQAAIPNTAGREAAGIWETADRFWKERTA
jgi:hypothetical protein